MKEQAQDEEYDWWYDDKEQEYTAQEMADHYQSVYETKADSVQHEANVIKQHLSNLKKNTFKNSKSTALDIASFIREDVESYCDKEVNITTRGEDIVEQARKGIREVLTTTARSPRKRWR